MIEKIQEIVAPYGVTVREIELITKGFLSENFKVVCDEGLFFLKQYRAELDVRRVQDIHRCKNYFADRGIPVVLPIANQDGDFFVAHDGRFFALFPFVDGQTYPDQHCSTPQLQSLARMLAGVHRVGETADPDHIEKKFTRRTREDAISQLDEIVVKMNESILLNGVSDFDHHAREILARKRTLLAAWPFADLELGHLILVHHDLHAGNVFFDEQAAVRHVFDFELAQYEPANFDVVRTMTIVCMDYGSAEEKWARVATFLAAYREVRDLSDTDVCSGVLEFVLYRTTSLWVEEEHYLKNNSRVDRFLECDEVSRMMWIEWLEQGGL